METKKIGVLAIICANIMWAIEPILAKLAYRNSHVIHTSTIRAIFVALTALPYVFITNKGKFVTNRKQFGALFYIAIAGTVTADLLYLLALTKIPVVNAILIGHMQPIFIVLICFFILREEKPSKFDYLGMLIMMIAGLLVTTRTLDNLSTLKLGTSGDLLVLAATVAWSTTAVAMKKYLKDMNAGLITFYRFAMAAVIFVVFSLIRYNVAISNIYQVMIGIVVGIGTILYYEGLKRIKAAQVSSLELSTPFFGAFLGFAILGEMITFMQISGILLMFAGVYFLSK
ncbi:DMT family transporter [Candidatus Poribacteria bacterium]|nr:DMT family transporter [Candidatus Poribacteria bacterium]